jgi:hypothetical protein
LRMLLLLPACTLDSSASLNCTSATLNVGI